MNLIIKNAKGLEGTFLGELHENSVFDKALFMELVFESVRLVSEKESRKLANSQVMTYVKHLFKVHKILALYISCHYDPNDYISLKDLPEYYSVFTERLELVIEVLLGDDIERLAHYGDEVGELMNEYELWTRGELTLKEYYQREVDCV